jgi:hypothetical protein
MNNQDETNYSGNLYTWYCVPCIYSIRICKQSLYACCLCLCCITGSSQEIIKIGDFKEETKEEDHPYPYPEI